MSSPPRASGYFRTGYAQDFALVETRLQRVEPRGLRRRCSSAFRSSPRRSGSISPPRCFSPRSARSSLMLLTGYAGQISLGHAGLLAAGAFTAGILFKELNAPFWLTLPAAALVGALLGVVFGLPSLRLRGLYLAVSTLALHFVVVYLGGEYETRRGFSTGITIDPPSLVRPRAQRRPALVFRAARVRGRDAARLHQPDAQPHRPRLDALRSRETVAEALGITVAAYKLLAFVISSALTSVAGCLFAYYRGFVSVEAFSLFLTIQYVAMIIIGGMGSLLGALLGSVFVTLFPYVIEGALHALPGMERYAERSRSP